MKCKNHPALDAIVLDLCGLCHLVEDKKHQMTDEQRKEFEKRWSDESTTT